MVAGRDKEAPRAIRRDPETGAPYAALAALLRRRLPDNDFEQMARLAHRCAKEPTAAFTFSDSRSGLI